MKRSFYVRIVTSKLWLPILAGGVALQSGCDPTIKDQFLSGVQTSLVGFVTAMINAVFASIAQLGNSSSSSGTSTSQPTVQAAFDILKTWLA